MHFPEQEQCFAAFKIDNGHVWQLASNSNFIEYQLVTLLGNWWQGSVKWVICTSLVGMPNRVSFAIQRAIAVYGPNARGVWPIAEDRIERSPNAIESPKPPSFFMEVVSNG